jgi:hypothetical protein
MDTDRDFTFDAAIDNISAYVMDLNWQNGFTQLTGDITGYDSLATPARLNVQLENDAKDFNPETLGSELVANGNFSGWTTNNPNSWTVTGESGTNPEISQVAADSKHGGSGSGACNIYSTSATVSIKQTILTVGKTYRLTLHVTALNVTAGGLRLYHGTKQIGYIINTEGWHTFTFNASDTVFKIESLLACDITIDDVSIKQGSLYGGFIYPGALFRLRAVYSAVTYPLFYGVINHDPNSITFTINPTTGQIQDRMLVLTIEDFLHRLLDAEYRVPLLTDVTVDQAIQRLFDDGVIRWPYGDYGTLLDIPGTNVLDYTARLYGYQTTVLALETGITRLEFVGDLADQGNGVSGQGYLRDLVDAEGGGRVWVDGRTNKLTFHNRHHDSLNTTIAATYTQSNFNAVNTAFGDTLYNEVVINYTSRSVGELNTKVWEEKTVPFKLEPGASREFSAHFVDPNNEKIRIGVQEGHFPEAGIDYDGSSTLAGGKDYTKYLYCSAEFTATSARVRLTNNCTRPIYVQTLQLRATPFLWQDETATERDGASIARYGYSPMPPKSIRLVNDTDFAAQVAKDYLRKFKAPLFRLSTVSFNGGNNNAQRLMGLTRLIGDRITITDSWSGHNADYVIVGEQHHVARSGFQHDVTWILKPITRETIYLVGVTGRDEIGSVNVIGL